MVLRHIVSEVKRGNLEILVLPTYMVVCAQYSVSRLRWLKQPSAPLKLDRSTFQKKFECMGWKPNASAI